MQQSKQEHTNRLYDLYAEGLIVISFVILQAFLSVPRSELDMPIYLSVLAFAIALPPLTSIIVLHILEKRYTYGTPDGKAVGRVQTAFFVGMVAAVIGIGAAFWHVAWFIGILFFTALLVVTALITKYLPHLHDHPGSNNPDET
ncbi:MAG: hypothetical protein JO202_09730 [Ktedonobacteraceae bacterium]|nr:hypothetical protein [Ktedonobacteraceae bacterium]